MPGYAILFPDHKSPAAHAESVAVLHLVASWARFIGYHDGGFVYSRAFLARLYRQMGKPIFTSKNRPNWVRFLPGRRARYPVFTYRLTYNRGSISESRK